MEIEVKQEHIDKGERDDCFGCPIFWAIAEALGEDFGVLGGSMVGVSSKMILIDRLREDPIEIRTPDPVRRRMSYYDRTGNMKPFKFQLDHPGIVQRTRT